MISTPSPLSLSILIVDDSPSERLRLQSMLHHLGHQVTAVPDGAQALDCLCQQGDQIDLILLDVCMPGEDGYQTVRRIRAQEISQQQQWRPVIFLSGRTRPEDIAQGIEAGGDDYLGKPVNAQILKAKIIAMQRIAHMRQQLLASQQQLEHQAHTDELTELPNRRYFYRILDKELARSRRHRCSLTVAYVDLDHFKNINDSHGHEAGDRVLRTVARTLSDNLRSEDSIGRLGGEEFCICLPGSDARQSIEPCERYRSLIQCHPIRLGDEILTVTASFGLATFLVDSDDRDSLLARADEALYLAKQQGRNRVQVL